MTMDQWRKIWVRERLSLDKNHVEGESNDRKPTVRSRGVDMCSSKAIENVGKKWRSLHKVGARDGESVIESVIEY